jgi:hypothetical protein
MCPFIGSPRGCLFTTDQILTVLSKLPEPILLPSLLNLTIVTVSVWPAIGGPDANPVVASHNRIVLSILPEAMRLPSGLNATLVRVIYNRLRQQQPPAGFG